MQNSAELAPRSAQHSLAPSPRLFPTSRSNCGPRPPLSPKPRPAAPPIPARLSPLRPITAALSTGPPSPARSAPPLSLRALLRRSSRSCRRIFWSRRGLAAAAPAGAVGAREGPAGAPVHAPVGSSPGGRSERRGVGGVVPRSGGGSEAWGDSGARGGERAGRDWWGRGLGCASAGIGGAGRAVGYKFAQMGVAVRAVVLLLWRRERWWAGTAGSGGRCPGAVVLTRPGVPSAQGGRGRDSPAPPCGAVGRRRRLVRGLQGRRGKRPLPGEGGSLRERAGVWPREVPEVKVVWKIGTVKLFHFTITLFYFYFLLLPPYVILVF